MVYDTAHAPGRAWVRDHLFDSADGADLLLRIGRSGAAQTAMARPDVVSRAIAHGPRPSSSTGGLTSASAMRPPLVKLVERLFMFTRQGEDEVMTALDATSGKVVWRTPTPRRSRGESNSPARRRTQVHSDVCQRPPLHARHDEYRHCLRRHHRQTALAEARNQGPADLSHRHVTASSTGILLIVHVGGTG